MRQLYTTLLLLLASLGCVAQVTFTEGQLSYTSTDGKTVSVSAIDKYISGDIVIPDSVTYEGVTYGVTKVGGEAFRFCSFIDTIIIPNSVTEIGSYAFS